MLHFMFASALPQLATATTLVRLGIVACMLSLAAGIQKALIHIQHTSNVASQVKQSSKLQNQRQ